MSDLKKIARNIYNRVFDLIFENKYREILNMKLSKDITETDDSVFYVISCEKMPFQGMFGYVDLILAMILYAIKHNMIPVIDMKNFPNTYLEDNEVGKIDAWELFFKPIAKTSIDEVYASKKYVIGNHMDIDWNNRATLQGVHNRQKGAFWSTMYCYFVRLSDEANRYCDSEYRCLLQEKEMKTLGVLIRGTDIKNSKGHAIQPEVQQVVRKIHEILEKDSSFEYIYLATEEFKNERIFREEFPGRIIVNDRTYYDNVDYSKGLSYVKTETEHDRYHRGMQYLSSVRLLSRCGGLVAGQCGGAFAAYYWNNGKYRYSYFWELGTV